MAQTLPQETVPVEAPPSSAQWACLFTKHKTQKHKVWHDGRLVLQSCVATLYNADPPPGSADPVLDECEISAHQRRSLVEQQENQMETENYLIQLDGPWTPRTNHSNATTGPKSTAPTSGANSSMQKLLSRKYQKPKRFIPPSQQPTQSWQTRMVKRRRPLQPGELHRMHHGAPAPPPAPTPLLPRQNAAPALSPTPTSHIQPQQSQISNHLSSFQQAGQVPQHQTPQTHQQQQVPQQPKESFVSALELSVPTNNASTKQTHQGGLVSNDFNASSFYGLDEEEESEEDAIPSAFVPFGAPPASDTTAATTTIPNQHQSPKTTWHAPPNSVNTEMEEQQSCVRTTNDVLALFGAVPDSGNVQPSPAATEIPREQSSTLQFSLAPIDASDDSEDDGF